MVLVTLTVQLSMHVQMFHGIQLPQCVEEVLAVAISEFL